MWGGDTGRRRDRLGACKCARQGSHLGSLRLGSSAQGPGWGREGGGEGEEGSRFPGRRAGCIFRCRSGCWWFIAIQLWATDCSARSPGAAQLGHHLLFYSKPIPAPAWRPFPRPKGDQTVRRSVMTSDSWKGCAEVRGPGPKTPSANPLTAPLRFPPQV